MRPESSGLHAHFEEAPAASEASSNASTPVGSPALRRPLKKVPSTSSIAETEEGEHVPDGVPDDVSTQPDDSTHGTSSQPDPDHAAGAAPAKPPPCCPRKMIIFTVNLLVGLTFSQLMPEWLMPGALGTWRTLVKVMTMWCLSYIMVHVGYEFDIDKSRLRSYAKDYAVGMTAAGLPWIGVAAWFIWVLPNPLGWKEALVAARFAAPTSAGILFAMLEAAGMKKTWLFQKARILAIFDDLDTILLMVPLKVIVVGMRWELSIDLGIVVVCFLMIWFLMHRVRIPCTWQYTMLYATIVAVCSEMAHFLTHDERVDPYDVIETVHLEVLLPAFTIGCIVRAAHATQHDEVRAQRRPSRREIAVQRLERRPSIKKEKKHRSYEQEVNDIISSVFMFFVGLSMPSLFNTDSGHGSHRMLSALESTNTSDGSGSHGSLDAQASMGAGALVGHVAVVSIIMILGKMFPIFVYRDEVNFSTRLALSLGMCPRGEVGAGVIVISLTFGIGGDAITIAVICLALNLMASSLFIMSVKLLAPLEPTGTATNAPRSAAYEAGAYPALPPAAESETKQSNGQSNGDSSV